MSPLYLDGALREAEAAITASQSHQAPERHTLLDSLGEALRSQCTNIELTDCADRQCDIEDLSEILGYRRAKRHGVASVQCSEGPSQQLCAAQQNAHECAGRSRRRPSFYKTYVRTLLAV